MNKKVWNLIFPLVFIMTMISCTKGEEAPIILEESTVVETTVIILPEGEEIELDDVLSITIGESEQIEQISSEDTEISNVVTPDSIKDTENGEMIDSQDNLAFNESTKPSEEITSNTSTILEQPTIPLNQETIKEDPALSENDEYCCEYGTYMKMSPSEQELYMRGFDNPLTFIEWCKNAELVHKEHDDTINVEGGNLDVSAYVK